MKPFRVILPITLVIALFGASCSKPKDQNKSEITVAAAADLESVFAEIARDFESATGVHITFSFGSSGNLKQQIENGAPFDAFASANVAYVDALAKEGLTMPDRRRVYAEGQITLWQRKDTKVQVNSLQDLTKPEVKHIAIANPGHAPYGAAAVESLQSAGIYDQVQSKLVFGENVLETRQFVQSGNAEVGIVARALSDVPDCRWVPIDPASHKPIDQAVCVIKASRNGELAGQFVEFLGQPQAAAALRRYGFTVPENGDN